MILTLANKGKLKISPLPLTQMTSFRQDDKEKLEAGGVLLGRFIRDSKNIIVDRVTVPMLGDRRGKYEFIRGEKMHQNEISSIWERSNGTCNYLGEWHTHPEMYPSPSRQDIRNWKTILSKRVFSSLCLYFVIVGTEEIVVWEGNRRTEKIKRLHRNG